MFFGVDHLVLSGSRADHTFLAERLSPAGFVAVPGRLRFDAAGVHSESVAYRDGAYLEVVYQVGPEAPEPWFAAAAPRIMGLGVSTDDFERDTAGWRWTMDEEQILDTGSTLRIHAAGPHEHHSPLYLFAMDRPDRRLDHPELGGSAELCRLSFRGAEHELWRSRLADWLGDAETIGTVECRFESAPNPGTVLSAHFAVPAAEGTLPLAAGAIELKQR
jgi:hypothetical protein